MTTPFDPTATSVIKPQTDSAQLLLQELEQGIIELSPTMTTPSTFDPTKVSPITRPQNDPGLVNTINQLETGLITPDFSFSPDLSSDGIQASTTRAFTISIPNQIVGTPNADNIIGTSGVDIIASLAGDDTVTGAEGDDVISGGSGNDSVDGGLGKDILYGDFTPSGNSDFIGSGDDTLKGGAGADQIYGQDGNDSLDGGSENDLIEGGKDNDFITGGNGHDVLLGDDIEGNPSISGNDTISGGNGNDQILGGRGNDILRGDSGQDLLVGGIGNDNLSGANGNDILVGADTSFYGLQALGFGFGEIDTLTGGALNDTFVLGFGQANGRDANGNNTVLIDVVLYNDGNNTTANGIRDYALINDFGRDNFGPLGQDVIQLAGQQSWYSLGASPVNGISGTGIFYNEGQTVPELIGIIQNVVQADLSLSNQTQFIFV
jgi:Ca2+-binding RTX toxin-like protein